MIRRARMHQPCVEGWGQRSLIKSIQRGSIGMTGGLFTNTATITQVNTAQAVLHFLGCAEDTGGSGDIFARLTLTNATTVTATRGVNNNTCTVKFEVVEYFPGVLRSVQRGTITMSSAASGTATPSPALNSVERTSIEFQGCTTDDNASGNSSNWYGTVTLTNITTVTAAHGSAANNVIVGYQLTEWL